MNADTAASGTMTSRLARFLPVRSASRVVARGDARPQRGAVEAELVEREAGRGQHRDQPEQRRGGRPVDAPAQRREQRDRGHDHRADERSPSPARVAREVAEVLRRDRADAVVRDERKPRRDRARRRGRVQARPRPRDRRSSSARSRLRDQIHSSRPIAAAIATRRDDGRHVPARVQRRPPRCRPTRTE